jgi:hypothetical protein
MPGYRARVEERVVLDAGDFPDELPTYFPDVKIVARPDPSPPVRTTSGLAVAEPVVVLLNEDSITETFIQIIDPKDNSRVVTVIEFLSPSNKRPGKDLNAYLAKQEELMLSDVSLVEIDLLRAGTRAFQYDFDLWPKQIRHHYAACTIRAGQKSRRAELFGFNLRDRLPAIPIPLRPGDKDAVLDLQALVDLAYEDGGYDDTNYRLPPDHPLAADDEVWSNDLLRAAGKR